MVQEKRKQPTQETHALEEDSTVKLPKKSKYRQRAHCNPLQDVHVDVPIRPEDVNWKEHFPELYEEAETNGTKPPSVDFVDIGCGFGGLTVRLAEAYPNKLVVGMEIRKKVSDYVKERILALRAKEPGHYRNASVIRTNTMKHLIQYFPKESIEKLFFLFPDPHFKTANYRRRIIQSTLLDEYAYLLKPGGLIYTITDVEDLGNWMREKLENHPLFEEVPDSELEHDAAAGLLVEGTEEGQKVKRNQGNLLAYPISSFIALKDVSTGKSFFLSLDANIQKITALSSSSSTPLLACAGTTRLSPLIIVYDVCTRIKRKSLHPPLNQDFKSYDSISISHDGQYVAALTNVQEKSYHAKKFRSLILWSLETGKVVANNSIEIIQRNSVNRVNVVSCSFATLNDDQQQGKHLTLSVLCGGAINLFNLEISSSIPSLKPTKLKLEVSLKPKFTCQYWIARDDLKGFVLGTASGDVFFITEDTVRCSCSFGSEGIYSLGFSEKENIIVALLNNGSIVVSRSPRKVDKQWMWHEPHMQLNSQLGALSGNNWASICIIEDTLFLCESGKLVSLKYNEDRTLRHESMCHTTSVISGSIGRGAPCMATLDSDGTIIITDYQSRKPELAWKCTVEKKVFNISMHPSCNLISYSFNGGFKISFILADRLHDVHCLSLCTSQCGGRDTENCECSCMCAFSNGGQYIAAANSTNLYILDSYTFEVVNRIEMKSTFGTDPIIALRWSAQDSKLLLATRTAFMVLEIIDMQQKSFAPMGIDCTYCMYTDIVDADFDSRICEKGFYIATKSGRIVYFAYQICDDKMRQNIVLRNEISLESYFQHCDSIVTSDVLHLKASNESIAVGTSDGMVVCLPLELDGAPSTVMRCTLGPVHFIINSSDLLITGSSEGNLIFLSKYCPSDNSNFNSNSEIHRRRGFCSERCVLMARSDLENMNGKLESFPFQIEEAIAQRTLDLNLCLEKLRNELMESNEKIKNMDLENKERTDRIMKDREVCEGQLQEKIVAAEKAFENRLAVMEAAFSKKAAQDIEKYQKSENELLRTVSTLQENITQLEKEQDLEIQKRVRYAERKARKDMDLRIELEQQLEDLKSTTLEEKESIKKNYESILREERHLFESSMEEARRNAEKLHGQVAILQRQVQEQNFHSESVSKTSNQLKIDLENTKAKNNDLEKQIKSLNGENEKLIEEKDNATKMRKQVMEKIQMIEKDLQNAEEKQNEYLDSNLKIQNTLVEYKLEMEKLKIALTVAEQTSKNSSLKAAEYKRREGAIRGELQKAGQENAQLKLKIRSIQRDIEHTAGFIQEDPSNLKHEVIKIFKAHVQGK